MSRPVPWDDIATPSADYIVRLAAGGGKIPVYWGKDTTGQCLLIIELTGNHMAQFRKDSTSANGICVDLRNGEIPDQQRLVLTLERHVDRDLFLGLCETLIASLAPVSDSAAALGVTLAHIKRWKTFLAGKKSRILSPEEIRGLFAELAFLRSLYERLLPQTQAIAAWCGAEKVHQDFIFGDTAVEVKSLSGRERSAVRISSEDQLEALSSNLFLRVYRLSEMPDAELALSLNDGVRRIEGELNEAQAVEEFARKIAACGYAPLPEYDAPMLLITGIQDYRVEGSFPRLIRSQIPSGTARLSYDIKLEAIRPFECGEDNIFGRS